MQPPPNPSRPPLAANAARARAFANIALAKYWGKSDVEFNLPAVPSISVTLAPLETETSVAFDPVLSSDLVELDGRPASEKEAERVRQMLTHIRALSGQAAFARVKSHNHFPTAAGLASSASGFAALAAAAARAAKLEATDGELSAIARQASASAARSIFGGFVELPAGKRGEAELEAFAIAPADHWDLRVIVAVVHEGPKDVGSTRGMEHSRLTSPFYEAWVQSAPKLTSQVRDGVRGRNLPLLGPAMEQSTMAFHSCAISSSPSIMYWQPPTLAVLRRLHALRNQQGVGVWCTMDAGPHVKAVCEAKDAAEVSQTLRNTPEVLRIIEARPGGPTVTEQGEGPTTSPSVQ